MIGRVFFIRLVPVTFALPSVFIFHFTLGKILFSQAEIWGSWEKIFSQAEIWEYEKNPLRFGANNQSNFVENGRKTVSVD